MAKERADAPKLDEATVRSLRVLSNLLAENARRRRLASRNPRNAAEDERRNLREWEKDRTWADRRGPQSRNRADLDRPERTARGKAPGEAPPERSSSETEERRLASPLA